MRFVRKAQCWQIIESFSGVEFCLEELAIRKSYRVAGMCAELGCSERHFYGVFSRDIGLPPKAWLSSERMVVARRKLEGGKSVAETAADLGFLSEWSFRRRFKNAHGVTPERFIQGRQWFNPSSAAQPVEVAGPAAHRCQMII